MNKPLTTRAFIGLTNAALAATFINISWISVAQSLNLCNNINPDIKTKHRPLLNAATVVSTPNDINYDAPFKIPVCDKILNDFQIWAIRRPKNPIAKVMLPPIAAIENFVARDSQYLARKQALFGPNFCLAGQVVLGDQVSTNSRGLPFHTNILNHAEEEQSRKKNEYAMKLIKALAIDEGASQRQQDSTARRLLREVAQDYADMDHSKGGEFFTALDRGLLRFMIRYMHYILFRLDPDDETTMDILTKLYFGQNGLGSARAAFCDVSPKKRSESDRIHRIYNQSPILSSLTQHENDLGFGATVENFVQLIIPLLGVAAFHGPLCLAKNCLGGFKSRQEDEPSLDPLVHWDGLADVTDRKALERHMYKYGQLAMPIGATKVVAPETFSAYMTSSATELGESTKVTKFPAGTIIRTPITLERLNKEIWGSSHNTCSVASLHVLETIFPSTGKRTDGFNNLGNKGFTTTLMADLLREIGQVRRRDDIYFFFLYYHRTTGEQMA